MKEIKISIDNCKISFTSYADAIQWLQKEQVSMNSDKFLKLVKSNDFLQNYLKQNNYILPIGRVSNSSYKGYTANQNVNQNSTEAPPSLQSIDSAIYTPITNTPSTDDK